MKSFVCTFILLFTVNLIAAQSVNTKISTPYSSIRALGMGNAFTAVADDYSLILYNPAGFARKKQNEIQFSLVGAGLSSKTLTLSKDIKTASDTAGTDAAKAQAVSDVLEKYYGQSLGGKIQAAEFFWVRNDWGVALLPLDLTIDMSINRQLGPAIDLNVKGDTTMAIGYGREIKKNIDAGLTLKYVHRVSIEEIIPALELATDPNVLSDKRFKEGTKFDFDLGFMWRPNWFNKTSTTVESAKAEPEKTEPVKVETIPAPIEEPKKEEPKAEEIKSDDKKVEEERKPQAEGDAQEIKVPDEPKTADVPVTAASDATEPINPKTEIKVPEEKMTILKPDEIKAPESKAVETSVATSDEKFPLTLGLVVHNVIGSDFTLSKQVNKNATEVPTKMYRVIDLGSQYLLRDGADFKIRYMLDFQGLLHPEITLNKSFHTGFELDYSPNSWFKSQVRIGFNQMYYTAGASFLLAVLNIDIVTYGEEVGSTDTKLENRVMAAKIGFNF